MEGNWFVGLPVATAAPLLARLGSPPPRVRLFHPADLHITVAFLGPVGVEAARAGWAALEAHLDAVSVHAGTVVALDAVRALGSSRRPSAITATFGQGRPALEALLRTLRDPIADAAGARRETRPPTPHVTFARVHRRARKDEHQEAIRWARSLDIGGLACRLESLALYGWAKDRSVRQFACLAERPLPHAPDPL